MSHRMASPSQRAAHSMYGATDSQIILFNFREIGHKPLESSHFQRNNPFFLTFPVEGNTGEHLICWLVEVKGCREYTTPFSSRLFLVSMNSFVFPRSL